MPKTLTDSEKLDQLLNSVAALSRLQTEQYEDLIEKINNLNFTEQDYSIDTAGDYEDE